MYLLTLIAIILASLAALGWLVYAVLLRFPKLTAWISSLGNPQDQTTEVKLVAFGVGVGASIGWLTFALVRANGKIDQGWNYAFITFGILIGLGATVEVLSKRNQGGQ